MATALMEVSEGRIPSDRIALRELWREISAWPALDEPTSESAFIWLGCWWGGGSAGLGAGWRASTLVQLARAAGSADGVA